MMSERRRYWLRILLANFAGALAVVGVNGGFSPGVRWSALVRGTWVSLVYANCIGTLLALTMPTIARRCWGQSSSARWAILLAAMVVITTAATFGANVILFAVGYIPRGQFWDWLRSSISISMVIALIIGVAVTAYETMRGRLEETTVALRTKERDEAEARRLATEAQLASLESRVQPHFLFNTLNSIAALVHDDPAGAERMTGQLASLLRSSLDQQGSALVPLDEEIRHVRIYLDIERVRFGDRLRYEIHVDDGAGAGRVPRLAVQTLVENSVKYAVGPSRDGAWIAVRAAAANGQLRIDVEDNGPGFDASAIPDGHGLALLRDRLAMTFGNRASLEIESRTGSTTVIMNVPTDA